MRVIVVGLKDMVDLAQGDESVPGQVQGRRRVGLKVVQGFHVWSWWGPAIGQQK